MEGFNHASELSAVLAIIDSDVLSVEELEFIWRHANAHLPENNLTLEQSVELSYIQSLQAQCINAMTSNAGHDAIMDVCDKVLRAIKKMKTELGLNAE